MADVSNSSNPKEKNLNSAELGRKGVLDEVISIAGDSTPGAGNDPEKSREDAEKARRDEALFLSLQKKKKKKKRRIIRTILIVIVLLLVAGIVGVTYLRRKVTISTVEDIGDVLTYEAKKGSISTTVSGSGTLANVTEEYVTVPEGVEIGEVVVEANDKVSEGDIIATLDMATVRTTIAAVQSDIDALDDEIQTAAKETVDQYITTRVTGRVKKLYAQKGTNVPDCVYENGALAVLSLDGKMAFEIPAGSLKAADKVTVLRENGKQAKLEGKVESVTAGTAVILVTDNGTELDEPVTAVDTAGNTLGEGRLSIHKPLRITGIAGTVYNVYVVENRELHAGDILFSLSDTSYSANYETLIKQRGEKEELLLELMQINRDGALLAPFSGSVASVIYDDGSSAAASDSSTASVSSSSSYYGMSSSGTGAAIESDASSSEEGVVDVIKLSPDEKMEVSISVDESNIMSLELGQKATVTVSSISEDTFSGKVTEINKTASSASGVTRYSAVVTLKKDGQMLPGMTGKVVISIRGVDDAIIIPVDALHQTRSTSYVYTSYDEEMKEFGGMVEVEAGISNSTYVEITSGLNEGDTVYYVESEDDPFARMFSGGFGGGMPGGGGDGNFRGPGRR